jgi:hypothetical protein
MPMNKRKSLALPRFGLIGIPVVYLWKLMEDLIHIQNI